MKFPAAVRPTPPPPPFLLPARAPPGLKPNPLCQGQITTLFNWRWASLTIELRGAGVFLLFFFVGAVPHPSIPPPLRLKKGQKEDTLMRSECDVTHGKQFWIDPKPLLQ